MVNYFKTLLPVTTVVDDLIIPSSANQKFYGCQRFYIIGFHCAAWMKMFCIVSVLLCVTIAENVIEDATNLKIAILDSARKYHGIIDLIYEWDTDSITFVLGGLAILMMSISTLFALTMITGLAHFLIPFQVILLGIFHFCLEKMSKYFTQNVATIYEIFMDVDEMASHLDNYVERDIWIWGKLGVTPKYEPVVRNSVFISVMIICLLIEYFIERAMQFYNYERFLRLINRPVIIAYRKWQFKKMMAERRAHQRARLVRRHQNANGNYTWNCEAVNREWSLHTAVAPDDDGDSLRTAVEFDENESAYKNMIARKTAAQLNKSCKF